MILSDLLESEINDQEIKKILGMDLKDEQHIRNLLSLTNYTQYQRLSLECESRKALLVVLYSMNLNKRLKAQVLKGLAYPVLLLIFSLFMMIFVNGVILPLFQSMLLFLGPKLDLSMYQVILLIFIVVDLSLLVSVIVTMILLKNKAYRIYYISRKFRPQNIWTRLISHQFCEKFLYFYRLGGSIDLIFKQIQWSSSPVLSQLCFETSIKLENGQDLTNSIKVINPDLQAYFKMNEEGIDITKYLQHYANVQELIVINQIKKYGKILLAYSYIKISFMIMILYQVMLKPIEMMENIL
jgi:type II secretory pathway component PulF